LSLQETVPTLVFVYGCKADTRGLLKRAHVIAGEFRYIGKETDRKWEEGDEISVLEFKTTEYGRSRRVIATEDLKKKVLEIGINKCARESGFDRKNFIRKLIRGIPVKRNSYNQFVAWLQHYEPTNRIKLPKIVLYIAFTLTKRFSDPEDPQGQLSAGSMSSIRRDVKKKVLPRPEARFVSRDPAH
jgi:hypothetical protein